MARRFAARIGVVREAAGIVAYRAGHFSEALSDLRAAKRMTGSEAYLPVMADCERGLGRPERAIDLVRAPEAERLDRAGRIELTIVESGARRDLGQHDAAVITLQRLPELRDPQPKPWSARLAFAYADALADAGHQEAATDWFGRAMAFDEDGETEAAERYAELTGAVIEDVEEDFDEESDEADSEDADVTEPEAETVGTEAEADEAEADEAEADDAVALAEAGDLLDADAADIRGDAAEQADSAEDSAQAGSAEDLEQGTVGDVLDEEQPEESGSASEAPEANTEHSSPEDAEDASEQSGPEDAEDASEQPGTADVEGDSASEAVPSRGETREATEQGGNAPSITPAFIEPNFGDVLNDSGDTATERPKTDD
ncbi:hypothetical protein [Nonomuraea insulae]|uniref:TPR-repeat-containing protein n=1 Tax=Nonomuraea insulae TaxID=1616787 RepID=A0ABW1DAE6_9ACTN